MYLTRPDRHQDRTHSKQGPYLGQTKTKIMRAIAHCINWRIQIDWTFCEQGSGLWNSTSKIILRNYHHNHCTVSFAPISQEQK